MAAMVAEARMCLETGVVRSPDDVDYAMLKGAGFPAFRGGLMRYAAEAGMA
jgi:3-hydroxyacyl-CoA dehydrogenase